MLLSVWASKFVTDAKRRSEVEGVENRVLRGNIWTQEGGSNKRVDTLRIVVSCKIYQIQSNSVITS
jgi:hypothetical protein